MNKRYTLDDLPEYYESRDKVNKYWRDKHDGMDIKEEYYFDPLEKHIATLDLAIDKESLEFRQDIINIMNFVVDEIESEK